MLIIKVLGYFHSVNIKDYQKLLKIILITVFPAFNAPPLTSAPPLLKRERANDRLLLLGKILSNLL